MTEYLIFSIGVAKRNAKTKKKKAQMSTFVNKYLSLCQVAGISRWFIHAENGPTNCPDNRIEFKNTEEMVLLIKVIDLLRVIITGRKKGKRERP